MHRFTVGDDPELDKRLLRYDALGSAAHARMLAHAGLMPAKDAQALVDAAGGHRANVHGVASISITPEQEDCPHRHRDVCSRQNWAMPASASIWAAHATTR